MVGVADELTGQTLNAFVSLKDGHPNSFEMRKEVIMQVRKSIGPFAAPKVNKLNSYIVYLFFLTCLIPTRLCILWTTCPRQGRGRSCGESYVRSCLGKKIN